MMVFGHDEPIGEEVIYGTLSFIQQHPGAVLILIFVLLIIIAYFMVCNEYLSNEIDELKRA